MRFTDLYTRVSGGTIRIDGQAGRTGPVVGTIDHRPLRPPATSRRWSASPSASPGEPGGDFNPRRVSFERMVAHFRKADRVITIEDALLAGPTVGATFSGRYDLSAAKISITGTYLPAYAINNLFGRIPLLGIALGGGMREGLIGVTFKVDGPIGQPQVYFNPLSAVAPGIFRKIFEFQRPSQ